MGLNPGPFRFSESCGFCEVASKKVIKGYKDSEVDFRRIFPNKVDATCNNSCSINLPITIGLTAFAVARFVLREQTGTPDFTLDEYRRL
jgi:hypothetical protein